MADDIIMYIPMQRDPDEKTLMIRDKENYSQIKNIYEFFGDVYHILVQWNISSC